MAGEARKRRVKRLPLSQVKDGLSRYLQEAAHGEIVITRRGRPAGLLIGFSGEADWQDYQFERDPRFLSRVRKARESLRAGKGTRLEDIKR